MSALDKQVGGDHYKHFKIQPVEFIIKNDLSFLDGCIIKRLCRYKRQSLAKAIQDLNKCIHEIELIKEFIELK